MSTTDSIRIISNHGNAGKALHPLRLQILRFLSQPGSASSLAPKIGIPRQVANYHLRELEKAGLIQFVEEKRKGNCVERIYRSVAPAFVVSPSALSFVKADPKTIDRTKPEYLIALGSQLIDDVATLSQDQSVPTLALETAVSFRTEDDRRRFAEELALFLGNLAGKYHHESGNPFRLICAVHPEVEKL
ncbi:helix-turn-helix transcriptional regulator [bacterium]|nr:helix-turn-helix transcriptional regulator [bacterium]